MQSFPDVTRAALGLIALSLVPVAATSQAGAASGEWPHYSGDLGATKYSPLDQIDARNVRSLRIAWRRPAIDPAIRQSRRICARGARSVPRRSWSTA